MREVRSGVWHWQARHPEWESAAPWDPNVSSYGIDDGERLLLFDSLGVPEELVERAAERDTAIVLTPPWHERDSHSLVERLGVPVYTPRPDTSIVLTFLAGMEVDPAYTPRRLSASVGIRPRVVRRPVRRRLRRWELAARLERASLADRGCGAGDDVAGCGLRRSRRKRSHRHEHRQAADERDVRDGPAYGDRALGVLHQPNAWYPAFLVVSLAPRQVQCGDESRSKPSVTE